MGGLGMSLKPKIKVTFNEEMQSESYYYLKRLIEKILLDQLELDLKLKATLLNSSKNIMEKE
jgi:hypothetical protein